MYHEDKVEQEQTLPAGAVRRAAGPSRPPARRRRPPSCCSAARRGPPAPGPWPRGPRTRRGRPGPSGSGHCRAAAGRCTAASTPTRRTRRLRETWRITTSRCHDRFQDLWWRPVHMHSATFMTSSLKQTQRLAQHRGTGVLVQHPAFDKSRTHVLHKQPGFFCTLCGTHPGRARRPLPPRRSSSSAPAPAGRAGAAPRPLLAYAPAVVCGCVMTLKVIVASIHMRTANTEQYHAVPCPSASMQFRNTCDSSGFEGSQRALSRPLTWRTAPSWRTGRRPRRAPPRCHRTAAARTPGTPRPWLARRAIV